MTAKRLYQEQEFQDMILKKNKQSCLFREWEIRPNGSFTFEEWKHLLTGNEMEPFDRIEIEIRISFKPHQMFSLKVSNIFSERVQ